MELVLEKPGIYLREICNELFQLTGAVTSEATVCRFLKKRSASLALKFSTLLYSKVNNSECVHRRGTALQGRHVRIP